MANLVEITVKTNDAATKDLSKIKSAYSDAGTASGKGFSSNFDKSIGSGLTGRIFGKSGGSDMADAQKAGQDVGMGLGRGMLQKFQTTLGSGLLSGLFGTSGGTKLFGSAGNTVISDAAKQGNNIAQGFAKGLNDGFGSVGGQLTGLMSNLFGGGGDQRTVSDAEGAGKDTASGFASGLRSGLSSVSSELGGILSGLFGGSGAGPDLKAGEDSGTDAGKGFLDGFSKSLSSGSLGKIITSALSGAGGSGKGGGIGKMLTGGGGGGDQSAVGGALDSGGVAGGALPGVAGISGLAATITGLAGMLIAVLPAITAVAAGLAGIGGGFAILMATSKSFAAQMKSDLGGIEDVFKAAAAPLAKPLEQAATQIVGYFKGIEPDLKAVFADSASLIQPLVKGFEELLSGALPGFLAMIKAAGPVFKTMSGAFADLGKSLGQMFSDFAKAEGPSAIVLKAILDLVNTIFPILGKLGEVFATALAPAVAEFGKALDAVLPAFLPLGKILASLAGAVLTDLASVLGAVGKLLVALAPSFTTLAKVASNLFNTLENSGVFAILGDALESLAKPIANLVNTMVSKLAPILPTLVDALAKISGMITNALVTVMVSLVDAFIKFFNAIPQSALNSLVNALVQMVQSITQSLVTATVQLVQALIKLFVALTPTIAGLLANVAQTMASMAQSLTPVLAGIIKGIADALAAVVKAVPPAAVKPVADFLLALYGIKKLGALTVSIKTVVTSGIQKILSLFTSGTNAEATLSLEGSTAAEQMLSAFNQGGTLAAEKIRAALAGGGAEDAGVGAGAASVSTGGLMAKITAALAGLPAVVAGLVLGGIIKGFGDSLSPAGTYAGKLNKVLQTAFNLPGFNIFSGYIAKSLPALATFVSGTVTEIMKLPGQFDSVMNDIGADIDKIAARWFDGAVNSIKSFGSTTQSDLDGIRHDIASDWDGMLNDADKFWSQQLPSAVTSSWHTVEGDVKSAGSDVVSAVTSAWNSAYSSVKSIGGSIVSWVSGLPGKFVNALFGLGHSLAAFMRSAFEEMLTAMKNVASDILGWLGSFVSTIIGDIKKILGISSPSSEFATIGENMMLGLEKGIKANAHKAANAATAAAKKAAAKSAGAGSTGAEAGGGGDAANEALAKRMYPAWATGNNWNMWNYIAMAESGWNSLATNAGSGAFGIAQALGHGVAGGAGSHGNEYGGYGLNLAGDRSANSGGAGDQITWMHNYILSRYGSLAAAYAYHVRTGVYDTGGWLPTGVSIAINKTGRPERIMPPGAGGGYGMVPGGGGVVQLQVVPGGDSEFEQFMLTALRKWVRVKGGGSVQSAFGRS